MPVEPGFDHNNHKCASIWSRLGPWCKMLYNFIQASLFDDWVQNKLKPRHKSNEHAQAWNNRLGLPGYSHYLAYMHSHNASVPSFVVFQLSWHVNVISKHLFYCCYLGTADEEKKLNATYIISVTRKLGCSVFLLPEDIMEVSWIIYLYVLWHMWHVDLATCWHVNQHSRKNVSLIEGHFKEHPCFLQAPIVLLL